MKVLVIGRGGREHALCRKIKQSKKVKEVFVAPGNDGMKKDATLVNIGELEFSKLKEFIKQNEIKLVVVGPEEPLVKGITDELSSVVKVFGPDKYTAQLEGSKAFAKEVMARFKVPTASYEEFTQLEQALQYIETQTYPLVIKKDGLASGKGVVIPETKEEAQNFLKTFFAEENCKVIIEEFLDGEEFSLMSFVNGELVVSFDEIAQDHKRVFDGDKGANTGGMGAYTPVPQISKELIDYSVEKIVKPICEGLAKEGTPYVGFLYAGLIATKDGVKVIEFNARLGDPETQVLLEKMESDIIEVIENLDNGIISELSWSDKCVCGVVLASEGYPEAYTKDVLVENLNLDGNYYISALEEREGKYYSTGGRVLLAFGKGENIAEAKHNAYKEVDKLNAPKLFFRKDIGDKAIK